VLHGVQGAAVVGLRVTQRVPEVQRSPPQAHLHVPGAPAVLPVLVGRGGVELSVPQVSEGEESRVMRNDKRIKITILAAYRMEAYVMCSGTVGKMRT